MRFSVRMAAMMSRALAFSPLAIGADAAMAGSGRCNDRASGALGVGGTGCRLRPGGLSAVLPFAVAGGLGGGALSERESNSVGWFRDAFSRATYDGG